MARQYNLIDNLSKIFKNIFFSDSMFMNNTIKKLIEERIIPCIHSVINLNSETLDDYDINSLTYMIHNILSEEITPSFIKRKINKIHIDKFMKEEVSHFVRYYKIIYKNYTDSILIKIFNDDILFIINSYLQST
jgi:hypothetical protein